MTTYKNKKQRWQLPFLVLLIVGTVYAIRTHHEAPFQKEEGAIFGTFFHATYQCDSSLRNDIMNELQAVDGSLSMFNPQSVISRINRNEDMRPDTLFTEVFNLSKTVSAQTDGAFDITVAPLVNAWGFGFRNDLLPDSATIDSLRSYVGFHNVQLTEGRVHKTDPRTVLDCSAVAKGFGSDVVARLFRRKGIRNFMIEIGGEIVVSGTNPSAKLWSVGINRPVEDSIGTNNDLQTILKVTNRAMATSGNYRNFYYKDGKRYAHTIDPHTGYPVQQSVLSATVLAPDCATADAYATAFMVMGLDRARAVLGRHPELQAYFIYTDTDGNLHTYISPSLEKMIQK